MGKRTGKIHFRLALPCLALAAFLTLPPAVTWSKYVWREDIEVKLEIQYSGQSITSLLSEGYPSEFWVWDLMNIQASPTAEGLVLTAQAGYALPESIIIQAGGNRYPVAADGTGNPEGLAFDPKTGTLSVTEDWQREHGGAITVIAHAVDGLSSP